MVDEFTNLLGYASKEDWITMFKYYVPTFSPVSKLDPFDTELGGSVILPLQANYKL
jgi:hypothetical protein